MTTRRGAAGEHPEVLPDPQLSRYEGRSCRSFPLVRAVTATTAAQGAAPALRSTIATTAQPPR